MTGNMLRGLVVMSTLLGGCTVSQDPGDPETTEAAVASRTSPDPAPVESLDQTASSNAMTGGPQTCSARVQCGTTRAIFSGSSQISLAQAYARALQACIAACTSVESCSDLDGRCTRLD
jgi:hypothetical protein